MEILKARLKRHEGLRLKPYTCPTGRLTIGYGRNLDDVGISTAEADMMLERDLYTASNALMGHPEIVCKLNVARRRVCIELIFWIGLRGFLRFVKMISAIRAGDFEAAAQEMMDSSLGREYAGRARELAEIMRTGICPDAESA